MGRPPGDFFGAKNGGVLDRSCFGVWLWEPVCSDAHRGFFKGGGLLVIASYAILIAKKNQNYKLLKEVRLMKSPPTKGKTTTKSPSNTKNNLSAFRSWLVVRKNLTYGSACDCCTYLRQAIKLLGTDSDLFKRLTPEVLSKFRQQSKTRRACYYYDEYKRGG